MSLDWNTRACAGNEVTSGWVPDHHLKPTADTHIHADTNSLVWGAFCGFHVGGEITPKNIDEIVWRVAFLEKINRPWMSDKKFPTRKAIDNHLGMRTNCDTKTRKQWLAFVTTSLSNEVTRDLEREQLAEVA